MEEFKVGEYIIYVNGDRYELGRIKRLTEDGAFICYHEGETAAKTPYDLIHKLVNGFTIKETTIGGETFKESDDYKERFKAEYDQVEVRFNKLLSLMGEKIMKYCDGELDFKPSCDIELLRAQARAMDAYKTILEYRAKIEGINLE